MQCVEYSENFLTEDLFIGNLVSDCLLPCLRTTAHVAEKITTEYNGNLFSLMFSDLVNVKKTSVDKFSFMDSLNFFGSNLGLWPGLGLYQILEWFGGIFIASKLIKRLRRFAVEIFGTR